MDLLKLRYFYVVAHAENLSVAAQQLSLSQPALSKSIKNFEAELSMDLFFRKGKRLHLNDNGRFLLEQAKPLIHALRNIEHSLDEHRGHRNKRLAIVTTLPYTFTKILDGFMPLYPEVNVTQVPLSAKNLTAFIENGTFDVCLTTEEIIHPNVEWQPLFEEALFLTVPANFQETIKGTIILDEQLTLPFIGLNNTFSFRQLTDEYCREIGFQPTYRVEVEEATAILDLVKHGRGVAFTPETAIPPFDKQLKHLKILNAPFNRTIGLLKHRVLYPTTISKAFIEHCHTFFDTAFPNK